MHLMFENISLVLYAVLNLVLYAVVGFVVSYVGLEIAWHFTACRIHDKLLRPCMFKQVETMLLARH